MLPATAERQSLAADFEWLNQHTSQPEWLRSLRRDAMVRFDDTQFPSVRDEDWKYTSVAPVIAAPLKLAGHRQIPEVVGRALSGLRFDEPSWSQLVFINGSFAPEVSRVGSLPQQIRVGPIAELAGTVPTVERHLGRQANIGANAFVALNTALLSDGVCMFLPHRSKLANPVHVLWISTSEESDVASYPRTLLVLGRESQACIIEQYVGFGGSRYLSNAVTEILLEESARLEHYRVIREAEIGFHLGFTSVDQRTNSRYTSFAISMGGAISRNELNVCLDGEGAECSLNGLYVGWGTQHVDNHTLIDHRHPHGTSREVYKGVLDGRARGVFNGKVIVRPGAQKTDARQTNRNLLLSTDASVDTKPQLEIFADDVKCTHGAAIGQLDDGMVFYLKSRGLDEDASRRLLTRGFASEVLEAMTVDALRTKLDVLLAHRFEGAEAARELLPEYSAHV